MDSKKIGVVVVIVLIIVGFFMFNNYQQGQTAKEEVVKKADKELIAQKAKEQKQKADSLAKEQKAKALELEQNAKDAKDATELAMKNQEAELKLQEAKEAKKEQLAKLMAIKSSKYIFYFKSNEILLSDSEEMSEFFLRLTLLSEANLIEKVVVNAYTDSVGSDADNMKLSSKRAKALDEKLAPYKLQIQTDAKGETNPIASNDTKEGRGLNRRIEVTLF